MSNKNLLKFWPLIALFKTAFHSCFYPNILFLCSVDSLRHTLSADENIYLSVKKLTSFNLAQNWEQLCS